MNKAFTLAITAVTAIAGLPGLAAAGEPVHSVTGGGTIISFGYNTTIAINAGTDEEGNAFGTITWEYTAVSVPLSEPGFSGYPWLLAVTSLEVVDNMAWIEAVVVASPQVPGDVGQVVEFVIEDNGNGRSGTPDVLAWAGNPPTPVDIGNFIVK